MSLELPPNLRLRDRIFHARLSINGRDHEKSLGTHKLSEAKKLLRPALEELRAKAKEEPKGKTFGDLIHVYRTFKASRLRERTTDRWEHAIKPMIDCIGLNTLLEDITMQHVIDYEAMRARDGIAVSTLRLELAQLGGLLRHGEDLGWKVKNHVPAFLRSNSKTLLRHDEQRQRYLSASEEEASLAHLKALGRPEDADLVAFAIDTGLRRQEQFNTRWTAWDRARNEITVTEQLAKNHKARRVPLLPRAKEILERLSETKIGESDYIFGGLHPVPPQRAQQITKRLLQAGIDDLTWHDLRRTCGCRLLQDHEMDIHICSAWLGHSNIGITQRSYAFLQRDALHKAMAKSKVLFPGRIALGDM